MRSGREREISKGTHSGWNELWLYCNSYIKLSWCWKCSCHVLIRILTINIRSHSYTRKEKVFHGVTLHLEVGTIFSGTSLIHINSLPPETPKSSRQHCLHCVAFWSSCKSFYVLQITKNFPTNFLLLYYFQKLREGWGRMIEEVNSCMTYLIHYNNLCKCHNVPLPISTIKEKTK
jgi:hypothetical protein